MDYANRVSSTDLGRHSAWCDTNQCTASRSEWEHFSAPLLKTVPPGQADQRLTVAVHRSSMVFDGVFYDEPTVEIGLEHGGQGKPWTLKHWVNLPVEAATAFVEALSAASALLRESGQQDVEQPRR